MFIGKDYTTQVPIIKNNNYKYLFYGINQRGTYWKERHFKVLNRNAKSIPQVGDLIEAIDSVKIRKYYIQKKYGKWTNNEQIGTIHR